MLTPIPSRGLSGTVRSANSLVADKLTKINSRRTNLTQAAYFVETFFLAQSQNAKFEEDCFVFSHTQWITKYFFGRHWTAPDYPLAESARLMRVKHHIARKSARNWIVS